MHSLSTSESNIKNVMQLDAVNRYSKSWCFYIKRKQITTFVITCLNKCIKCKDGKHRAADRLELAALANKTLNERNLSQLTFLIRSV